MAMDTQEDAILKHLQKGKTITPLEALTLYGCLRLGARIWDLRKKNHHIDMSIVETDTGKHVAQYRMAHL